MRIMHNMHVMHNMHGMHNMRNVHNMRILHNMQNMHNMHNMHIMHTMHNIHNMHNMHNVHNHAWRLTSHFFGKNMGFEASLKFSGMNIWTLGSGLRWFPGQEAVKNAYL